MIIVIFNGTIFSAHFVTKKSASDFFYKLNKFFRQSYLWNKSQSWNFRRYNRILILYTTHSQSPWSRSPWHLSLQALHYYTYFFNILLFRTCLQINQKKLSSRRASGTDELFTSVHARTLRSQDNLTLILYLRLLYQCRVIPSVLETCRDRHVD